MTGNYRLTRRRRSSSVRKTAPVNKNAEWIEWIDFEGWRPVNSSSTSYRERDSGGSALLRWFQPPVLSVDCSRYSSSVHRTKCYPNITSGASKVDGIITHKDSKLPSNIFYYWLKDLTNNMRLTKCHKQAQLLPPPPPPAKKSGSLYYNSNCRSFESALLFTCSYFWQCVSLDLHLIDIAHLYLYNIYLHSPLFCTNCCTKNVLSRLMSQ